MGGKHRIARKIATHLEALATTHTHTHIEDRFCGALSISASVKHRPLVVSDGNPALICTLRAVQAGWIPPEVLDEVEYARLKSAKDPTDPLTAFAAAGCSFGGKWWGGYARGAGDYARASSRSLVRKLASLRDVEILCRDYRDDPPASGIVVYFDPPYADSVGYPACGDFDHAEFWRVACEWAERGVIVRVSEYAAPDGWIAAETFGVVQALGVSRGATKRRADVLWKLDGCH